MKKLITSIAVILLILLFSSGSTLLTANTFPVPAVSVMAASKTIHLSKSKVTLTTGETYKQKLLNKNDKQISNKNIKWTTSDKKIVKISSEGTVTAVKKGTATVSAMYKGKTYKCKVTVKNATLKYTKKSLTVGKSFTQKLTNASGKNIKSSKIKWSSGNTKVATVSKKGVVKAVSAGTAKITAKYKGKKYSCTVTVKKTTQTYKETTLANEYKPISAKLDKNSVNFQSFAEFSKRELDSGDVSTLDLGFQRTFSSYDKEDFDIIKDYVELICEKMNFKLVDEYMQEYNDFFFSYGFDYTGNKNIRKPFEILYLNNDKKVPLHIWGKYYNRKLEVTIQWSTGLEPEDLGYRCDGTQKTVYPAGKSAKSGLKRLTDGSFITTDKRLKTTLGKANILRDGKNSLIDIEYTPENRLKIFNYYGDESLWINFAESDLQSNNTLLYDDLAFARQNALPDMDPNFRVDRTKLHTRINGNWLYPVHNSDTYLDASLRVLYYEKDNIAVFYVYTNVLSETEFLCAVDLKKVKDEAENKQPENSGNSGSSSSSGFPATTEKVCNWCNNTGRVDCDSCIDGYYYSGGTRKPCVSIRCNNGWKDCSHCNN